MINKANFAKFLFFIIVFIVGFNFSDYYFLSKSAIIQNDYSDSLINVKVIVAGDAMMHEPQIVAGFNKETNDYNFDHYFQYISPLIKQFDLSIVNFETTLGPPPYSGYPQFCAPDAYALALKKAGFNFFLTANNHSVDRGLNGILRTIQILDSFNINFTGIFKNKNYRDSLYPAIVNMNGLKIAILNYTYGTNGIKIPEPVIVNLIDTAIISADLLKLKTINPDFIIATLHWGNEYEREPNKEQKKLAEFLFSKGVDIIIGSHPHVIQPIEFFNDDKYKNKLVIWSLGNLISNQRRQYTDGGLLASFSLVKNKYTSNTLICDVRYYPVWVYKTLNPVYYYILPVSYYGNDSLKKIMNSTDINSFEIFIKDTRKHLNQDTLRIKEFIY
ncbi:MAG TPA: CapA family protein [Bacteroidales bacterium]|nr:CapA family protein [Bacteroidales bacterium]